MDVGTALGGSGLFVSVAGIIYSAINHKHIRSNCCGKVLDFSIDIDSTTDKEAKEKEAKEKEAKEKEAKEKESKTGNTKDTKDTNKSEEYSMFRLKPRVVPHIEF
jgi:hypothetical protein